MITIIPRNIFPAAVINSVGNRDTHSLSINESSKGAGVMERAPAVLGVNLR